MYTDWCMSLWCICVFQAYGGAYDVMSSKHLRGDVNYAWPSAEVAVMGAKVCTFFFFFNVFLSPSFPLKSDQHWSLPRLSTTGCCADYFPGKRQPGWGRGRVCGEIRQPLPSCCQRWNLSHRLSSSLRALILLWRAWFISHENLLVFSGFVDDIIEPSTTRKMICRDLEVLASKKQVNPWKKHANIPL